MTSKAVLLTNLGSPDSTAIPDVRRYLKEFLSDERVFDAPQPIKSYILYCKVLPFRPRKTAEAYSKIWTKEGSPLLVTSRKVQQLLQEKTDLPIELSMRYGNPSTREALQRLASRGIKELFLVPLYPHYAMSSYETAVVNVRELAREVAPAMRITAQPPFFAEPGYIDALSQQIEPYVKNGYDHILFSFHGIPERHLRKGDPSKAHCTVVPDCCKTCSPVQSTCYRAQCLRTVEEVAARLQLPAEKYGMSFQSRFGREPWLKPYTDLEFVRLANEGVKRLLVVTPAFVSDCLETLEEIGIQGKEDFLAAGGESYELIPCLNEHPAWIDFLARKIAGFQENDLPEPAAKII